MDVYIYKYALRLRVNTQCSLVTNTIYTCTSVLKAHTYFVTDYFLILNLLTNIKIINDSHFVRKYV